jgi:iron complex outermembrane recepter protein
MMIIESWIRMTLRIVFTAALSLAAGVRPGLAAADLASTVRFDIGPQSLPAALLKYSEQSGVQVASPSDLIDGHTSSGVVGTYPARAALQHVLEGTGLAYAVIDPNSVIILPANATPSSVSSAGEAAAPEETEPKLQEITVTATRREESVEKVPISVEALSGKDIDQAGIKDIADLAAVVPGLQFEVPGAGYSTISSISIRGLNTATGASVVGVYLDDTPIQGRLSPVGNVGNPYPVLFDLNRVEVERGPQGTLFGAGSEAGTLRFIPNEPDLTTSSGFSQAEIASTQDGGWSGEAGAAVGGPIVDDQIGFRISVWDRHDGGYVNLISPIDQSVVTHNANTKDKLAIRGAMEFKLDESIRITPSIHYQSIKSGDSGRFYEIFSDPSAGSFNNAPLLPETWKDQFVLPTIKLEASLPFATLTAIASYFHRQVTLNTDSSAALGAIGVVDYGSPLGPEYATSPADVARAPTWQTARAYTEELRLASRDPKAFVTWVAGIFNEHRTQRDSQYVFSQVVDPADPDVYYANQLITDDQIAAFAQGDVHLTDGLTATLGARVAKVKSEQNNAYGSGIFNAGAPPLSSSSEDETPFTPRIALSYQADRNDLFYVSATKGYRVGGGNGQLPSYCNATAPNSYSSDYVWSYELGAKNSLFGGRAQIDTSVFHVNWSKIQQLISLPCGIQYTTNAGSAVSNGFDLAFQALVTDHLRVKLNLGYVNAYFTRDVFDAAGAPIVLAGDKIGSLPEVNPPWDLDTSAEYKIPLSGGEHIYLRGEFRYHSRNPGPFINQIPTSPSFLPLAVPDPVTHLYNARIGTTLNQVDVSLFVNNLFNTHPELAAYQVSPTSPFITNTTFRPRTFGLSASVAF